jgi:hypothetical protein
MKNLHTFEEFLNESQLNEALSFDKKSLKQKLKAKVEIAKKAVAKWNSQTYKDLLDSTEKAAKSGVLPGSYDKPFMVSGEDRNIDDFEIFNSSNAMNLAKAISEVISKYKKNEVDGSYTGAAAGWSGTMRSAVSGTIDPRVNFNNGKNNYLIAVTVGGGIDRSIKDKIFTELYPIFFILDEYNSYNGGVSINYDSGTNYDTFGLECDLLRFSPNLADQLLKIMTK